MIDCVLAMVSISLGWAQAAGAHGRATAPWHVEIVERWAAADAVIDVWLRECAAGGRRLNPLQVQVAWESGDTYAAQPIYPSAYDGPSLGAWLRYELALLARPPALTSTSSGARDWALASVSLTAEQRLRCQRLHSQCAFEDAPTPRRP